MKSLEIEVRSMVARARWGRGAGGMESNRSWIWGFFWGDENVLELVVTAQPFEYI